MNIDHEAERRGLRVLTQEALDGLLDERSRLRGALTRIQAAHTRIRMGDGDWCEECDVGWPCYTQQQVISAGM